MKVVWLQGKSGFTIFKDIAHQVYLGNNYFKGTDASIEKILLGSSQGAFQQHSRIMKFGIRDGNDWVARFALIHDYHLPNYVQVSFFEAQAGLGNIFNLIKNEIATHFPASHKVIVGLNGHLNYGAGILLNRFDEAPVFGLPYTPSYYANYFKELICHKMFTFRFKMETYNAWASSYNSQRSLDGLGVRFMNKKHIRSESAIYTQLNNRSFTQHPFWANRDPEEDLELFYPFRFLLDNENLIFAEVHGKPVGFFLWYPDFNQLVSSQRDLNLWDLLKFRLKSSIDTFRFTEIGIAPEFQGSPAALALISKSLPTLIDRGYKYCEGGFIFESNLASIAFVKRILKRCEGKDPEPYRQYAVYEMEMK